MVKRPTVQSNNINNFNYKSNWHWKSKTRRKAPQELCQFSGWDVFELGFGLRLELDLGLDFGIKLLTWSDVVSSNLRSSWTFKLVALQMLILYEQPQSVNANIDDIWHKQNTGHVQISCVQIRRKSTTRFPQKWFSTTLV